MKRKIGLSLTIAIIFTAGMIYFLVDPARSGWIPKCPFHLLTGLDCPGCGSQRMIHALLHGDLAGAWQANPFLLLCLPLIFALIILEVLHRRNPQQYNTLYRRVYGPATAPVVAIALIAWGIGRNLHFFFN